MSYYNIDHEYKISEAALNNLPPNVKIRKPLMKASRWYKPAYIKSRLNFPLIMPIYASAQLNGNSTWDSPPKAFVNAFDHSIWSAPSETPVVESMTNVVNIDDFVNLDALLDADD